MTAMMVEVQRCLDAERINALINQPDIRPWVAGMDEGALDLSATVANHANHLVMGEYGGILFAQLLPGIYEAHTVVDSCARGRWTKAMIQSAVHCMFTQTDAMEITTRIPQGHPAAMTAALGAGMRPEMTIPDAYLFRGRLCDVHVLSFRLQDWLPNAPHLIGRGRWFHARLAQEAERLGIRDARHEPDDLHNRYVGAAIEMMFGGQAGKAVTIYNRWARICRHPTVEWLSDGLIRFDFGLLRFGSNDIEVILEDAV
jgi:hypothetical protein